jgi:hypothetical protein
VAPRTQLRLFEDQATKAGVRLAKTAPALVNHAYIRFLMATALGRSYPEAYTVLYAACVAGPVRGCPAIEARPRSRATI